MVIYFKKSASIQPNEPSKVWPTPAWSKKDLHVCLSLLEAWTSALMLCSLRGRSRFCIQIIARKKLPNCSVSRLNNTFSSPRNALSLSEVREFAKISEFAPLWVGRNAHLLRPGSGSRVVYLSCWADSRQPLNPICERTVLTTTHFSFESTYIQI